MLVLVIGNMLSYPREISVIVKLRAVSNKIAGQIYPYDVWLTDYIHYSSILRKLEQWPW